MSADCTHGIAERETACADGMCPLCLANEITRLKENPSLLQMQSRHIAELQIENNRLIKSLSAADAEITRLRQLLGKARDELETIRSILRSLPASRTAVEVDAHLSELSDEIRKLIHYPPTEREITQS